MLRFGSESGRSRVVQMYDIELFNIKGVQQILIGTDLDQNIFYTLMRRHFSRSVRSHNTSTPQPRQQRRTNNQASCSQYQHIQNALETLDNHHAFTLLQTYQELSQDQHCLRTRLAHQLEQHLLCVLFAKKALQKLPNCKSCLNVYLSHSQEIPQQDLPLKEELVATFQNEFPQLFSLIPKLPSLTRNYMLYASMNNDLKQQGGELQKIGIIEVSSGRKIIAMQKIFRNQEILFVPKSHLITLELAKEIPLVQKLLQSRMVLRSPKHTQLAIFLLHNFQLSNISRFSSYLKTLPTQFSHFPIYYSEELLVELKGTNFLQQINQKKLDMRKDYETILAVDQTFARFQLKRFIQARLLVSSRVFGILVDEVKTDALVPVADMLNHKLPKQTSWFYCNNKQGFVIQSLKQIQPGCQVFDSYGQKCNSRFLLNYGFVLTNNPHNQISLDIDLTNLFHGLPRSTKIKLNKSVESKSFEEMLGLLRATLDFTPNQQQQEQEGNIFILQSHKKTPFKTVQLQIKVWTLIEELVSERLKQYPHTLAEDKRLLKNCNDSNRANIIILRRGEKQVLAFYQTMSKRVVRYLQSGGRRGDVTPYNSYIAGINAFGNCQSQN